MVAMGDAARLNIIIPALNESTGIVSALVPLQSARRGGARVVLVDGGSTDDTCARAQPLVDDIVMSPPGRAAQLNAGATHTSEGDFWFVHADTWVAEDAWVQVTEALHGRKPSWGRFDIVLRDASPALKLVAFMVNWRSGWSGIATGDQAMFMSRCAYERAGGFPQQPLMEDVEMSRRLKRVARPTRLRTRVATSSRRWRERGVVRTVLLMWALRGAYAVGVSPDGLARRYRAVR